MVSCDQQEHLDIKIVQKCLACHTKRDKKRILLKFNLLRLFKISIEDIPVTFELKTPLKLSKGFYKKYILSRIKEYNFSRINEFGINNYYTKIYSDTRLK